MLLIWIVEYSLLFVERARCGDEHVLSDALACCEKSLRVLLCKMFYDVDEQNQVVRARKAWHDLERAADMYSVVNVLVERREVFRKRFHTFDSALPAPVLTGPGPDFEILPRQHTVLPKTYADVEHRMGVSCTYEPYDRFNLFEIAARQPLLPAVGPGQNPAVNDFSIQGFERAHRIADVEALQCNLTAGRAHLTRAIRMFEKSENGSRHCRRIRTRDYQPIHAVRDELRYAADVRCNHRLARAHGFHQRQAERFAFRCDNDNIGDVKQRVNVLAYPEQGNLIS